ncbi:MAG TPA: hypothetical protein PLD54_01550 [Candidatus Levybacteria bacterium]|nr:hypothetical protein [Candidatus Levybacteria bacterium]
MAVSINRRHLQDYLSFYFTYGVNTTPMFGLRRETYADRGDTQEEDMQDVSQTDTSDDV